MASRKKASKVVAVVKPKPAVLLFRFDDFGPVRHALPAFDLPREVLEAPCFVTDAKAGAKMTLFKAIAEPDLPADVTARAFAFGDALLDLVIETDDVPIGDGPFERGFHAGATLEQVRASFEADGFRVLSVADLAACPQRPPAGSGARVERIARALAKTVDPDALAAFVRWLLEGGAEPDVAVEVAAPFVGLVLDEELETWGPLEDRLFHLAARRHILGGLRPSPGGEPPGADRWGLYAARLARAGWREDEIVGAWLDGQTGDRDWPSARWLAMALLPRLEELLRRVLDRADRVDPCPALARLLVEPIENLPKELTPLYEAGVRRLLEASPVAHALGPEVRARLSQVGRKATVRAVEEVHAQPLRVPARPVKTSPKLARVKELYGFDLPEELLAVWDLASSLSPGDPTAAFWDDALGIALVGPFEVLAGRTRVKRGLDMRLHFRYRLDPPEFFTMMVGDVDRLHFGYWYDDPAEGPACVAAYWVNDAYGLHVPGLDLWQTLRHSLESEHQGAIEDLEGDEAHEADYVRCLARLARLRERLMGYATGDRREVGEAYLAKYDLRGLRARHALVPTPEGMGVVAPAAMHRPLPVAGDELKETLASRTKRRKLCAQGLRLAKEGFPAAALELGRHCWAHGHDAEAYALLDAAYAGLARPLLREVLSLHRAHRDLKSVDVLAE